MGSTGADSDVKNDICDTVDIYRGDGERYREGALLQGGRHGAVAGSEPTTKPSSLIYQSIGKTNEAGVELKPFTLKRVETIRRTALLQHKPRKTLKFLSSKLMRIAIPHLRDRAFPSLGARLS